MEILVANNKLHTCSSNQSDIGNVPTAIDSAVIVFFNLIEVCLVFYALRCVLSLLFSPHTPPQSIAVHSNPSMLHHHHHHHTLLSVPTAPVKEKGCAFFTMPARSLVVAAVVDALPPYPPCCAAARMSSTEALEKVQIKLVSYNKQTIYDIYV